MDRLKVIQSNNLIMRCFMGLPLPQARIFQLTNARIHETQNPDAELSITGREYADLQGVDYSVGYRVLKRNALKLFNTSILLTCDHRGDVLTGPERHRHIYKILDYYPGEGRAVFKFSEEVLPYIYNLHERGNYTWYFLDDTSRFNSVHGLRLYEIMMRFRSYDHFTLSVHQLRQMLGPQKIYDLFSKFRNRVLRPAVLDINSYSPFLLVTTNGKDLPEKKKGRNIEKLLFKSERK